MHIKELERMERGKRLRDGIVENHARIKLLIDANKVGYVIGLKQFPCGVIVRDAILRELKSDIEKLEEKFKEL